MLSSRFTHSLKKGKTENCFFLRVEVEESSFIIDNNGSLISQCQRIQYDSTTKVCEAEKPQHHVAIEKYELN